MDDKSKKKEKK